MAGDGFKILLIHTETLATTVLEVTKFEITTAFPKTEQDGGANWLPEFTDIMQLTVESTNVDGKVTVTLSDGVINVVR